MRVVCSSAWTRRLGLLYLLCYLGTFVLHGIVQIDAARFGETAICAELQDNSPAPDGTLDLRPLGVSCGLEPLVGFAVLFLVPAVLAPVSLPLVPVPVVLFWGLRMITCRLLGGTRGSQ